MCLGCANKRRRRTEGGGAGEGGWGEEADGRSAVGRAGDADRTRGRIEIRREKRLKNDTSAGNEESGGGPAGFAGGDTNCGRVIYAGAFGRAAQITPHTSRLSGGLI